MKKLKFDRFKIIHWLNARKVTPEHVADKVGMKVDSLELFLGGNNSNFEARDLERLAEYLKIPLEKLYSDNIYPENGFIYQNAVKLEESKRAINRDGIHFYNYYTLPSPHSFIAPVILDILCPHNKIPMLNNGHLESAITVNLGPGDINGRWDEEQNDLSWRVLESNRMNQHDWIVGDTYVEPSYCRHTYSLVTQEPARILSYTVKSNLESVRKFLNHISDDSYDFFINSVKKFSIQSFLLKVQMDRHGYDAISLGEETSIASKNIESYIHGDLDALDRLTLETISCTLGLDYRVLQPAQFTGDQLGKVHYGFMDSVNSIRSYKSYRVASMAACPSFPDLSGVFMKVYNQIFQKMDLRFHGNTHYLLTSGSLTFYSMSENGEEIEILLNKDDSLWIAPYKLHGFSGDGSLIKMSNGENNNYLDMFELGNCFNLSETLTRAKNDEQGWGYELK